MRIFHKIKRTAEVRSGATDETGREEIEVNPPGPSGLRAAAVRFVERLARSPTTCCVALLPDQRTARETELIPFEVNTL